jgi:hypothetical protein
MRSLVILALLGCAYAAPFLQFTPEVVAERARFQQLYNAAAAAAAAAPDPAPRHATHFQYQQAPAASQVFTTGWRGPVAATVPAGVPGAVSQVSDTADVSAARDAFLQAYKAQVAATTGVKAPSNFFAGNSVVSSGRWVAPATTTFAASGTVGETAEVAAARSAFEAAYSQALARNTGRAVPAPVAPRTFAVAAPQPKRVGPVAATVPAGLPGSVAQVGPTADVSAATAAFHQAYSAAVAATTGRRV